METAKLKKFAQFARRTLLEQVSAKLKLVLAENSSARREHPRAVAKIEKEVFGVSGRYPDASNLTPEPCPLAERVAYTWFNRFCALRFMDVNRYTRIGVVSPAEGQFQPEILAEAKMGHIDEEIVQEKTKQQIFDLLSGRALSRDPQGEAYRLLVVASCNFFHRAMPFLFQRIDDYTELLMPDDLLSEHSILVQMRQAICLPTTEGDRGQASGGRKSASAPCTLSPEPSSTSLEVEVIGWLYQFYISEKKDEVFEGLKKNKKITPENIPAATQLFTPHWIVKYLVENSLGRLWMLNRPNSRLKEKMEYFITTEHTENTENKEAENSGPSASSVVENDFLVVNSPEEIKICDPACGSGHMLTYAFDLLYAIYEEEGYEPAEIPEKILTNNLYGIEIDERAGVLAAFALTMKALQYDKRFFRRATSRGHLIEPNICVLKNIHFKEDELNKYMDFVGRDLFTAPLQTTLRQFEEADNFGSLIRPEVTDATGMLKILESKNVSGHLFLSPTHEKVLQTLRQTDYLSPKYHVVIANPPYMGGKGMNKSLSDWIRKNYSEVKSDLFSTFILRILGFVVRRGFVGLMTPFTWMFLKSFASLRQTILKKTSILGLVQPEYHSFFDSAYVPVCAFNIEVRDPEDAVGMYIDLGQFYGAALQPIKALEAIKDRNCSWLYSINQAEFSLIPGEPLAFTISNQFRKAFREGKLLSDIAEPRQGLATANNDRYLRAWYELDKSNIKLPNSQKANITNLSHARWVPYQKGGSYRKWYGNHELVIDWQNDGYELKNDPKAVIRNPNYYFKEGMTWTSLTVASFNGRYCPEGFVFDSKGPVLFPKKEIPLRPIIGLMNCAVATRFLKIISPTMDFSQGPVGSVPFRNEIWGQKDRISVLVDELVMRTQFDWDSYETSWDFTSLPLLNPDYRQPTLKATYQKLRAHWREMTMEMQRLEVENNRIFIEAYGLQEELTPEVPLEEITLTCNPYYRYGKKAVISSGDRDQGAGIREFPIDKELEAKLLADTMRELVSYAVGGMFGRYALDKPGLILANQGETTEDYFRKIETTEHTEKTENNNSRNSVSSVVKTSFPPDEDNVIPILDGDWFTDDISERFKQFLKVAFGSEHYEENLRFVEESLNIKGKRNYGIRDYFLGEFYTDHVKRYKKRPIYWLFSSPKGSFNALIYMHRYRPDTVSIVLNDYLREYRTKLASHKTHLEAVSIRADVSQAERTRALKEIEKVGKMINELEEYEREVLYPLATERIEIDLDDGVKANYPRFGGALKKIPGLDAQGED